jgi:hypothetical protein
MSIHLSRLLLLMTFLLAHRLNAQVTSLTAGDWNTPTTWSSGTPPDASTDVIIQHAVTIPNSITASIEVNNLTIGQGGTTNATLTIANASSSAIGFELIVHGDLIVESNGYSAFIDCNLRSGIKVFGNVTVTRNHPSVTVGQVGFDFKGESYMSVDGNVLIEFISGNDASRELRLNRATLTIAGDLSFENRATSGTGDLYFEVFSTSTSLSSNVTCRDFALILNGAGANQDMIFNCRQGSTINVLRDFIVQNSGTGDMTLGLGLTGNSGNLIISGNTTIQNTSTGNITFDLRTNSLFDIHGNGTFTSADPSNLEINAHQNSELHFGGTITPSLLPTEIFNYTPDTNADPALNTNNSLVIFNGTSTQNIPGNETYCRLQINNPTALNLSEDITIQKELNITAGRILADNHLINVTGPICTGSSSGYICDGTLRRSLTTGAGPFLFPVGSESKAYSPFALLDVTATSVFEVTYYPTSASDAATPLDVTETDESLAIVSNGEYWNVEQTSGAATARVLLGWNSFSDVNSEALDKLRICQWASAQWNNTGDCNLTEDVSTGTLDLQTPIATFGYFTFGSTTTENNLLPVTFKYFEAMTMKSSVVLKWTTLSEINNKQFSIERSDDDAMEFKKIGAVDGHGTSHATLHYQFEDNQPSYSCRSYYRVRQIDFDGESTLTKVISIRPPLAEPVVFPNPVDRSNQSSLTLHLPVCTEDSKITLWLYNAVGVLQWHHSTTGDSGHIILTPPYPNLDNGVYSLQIHHEGGTFHKKLIIE